MTVGVSIANRDSGIRANIADCDYCKQASRFFTARKLPDVERDISNRQHRVQWTRLGGRAVPLFVINGQVSSGFNADGMTRRLQSLGWVTP